MSNSGFSIKEIKELMEAVKANEIEEFELSQNDFSIKIGGKKSVVQDFSRPIYYSNDNSIIGCAEGPSATYVEEKTEQNSKVSSGNTVMSPIVGTFYGSPAPDKPPYVKVGDKVCVGDVLFIIESMKLMNEVTSECAGTIAEICVKDGEPVEYGQPILIIE